MTVFIVLFVYGLIGCIVGRVVHDNLSDLDDSPMSLLAGTFWPFFVSGFVAFLISKKPAEWINRLIDKLISK